MQGHINPWKRYHWSAVFQDAALPLFRPSRAIAEFHALSGINYWGEICSSKSKLSFESMSALKCYCHPLLTALCLLVRPPASIYYFCSSKQVIFFFFHESCGTLYWKKKFLTIDLERLPITFCFLSLCCLNTCKNCF